MSGLPKGWSHTPLDNIADIQLGKMLDKAKQSTGSPWPYLRNVNVRWGRVDTGDLATMPFTEEEQVRFRLKQGDVLVCEGGEPGRTAIWHGGEDVLYQKAIHRLRTRESIEPRWLYYWLRHAASNGTLSEFFTGTTIKHLPAERLARVALPIAPPTEQQRIVAKLDDLLGRSRRAREALAEVPALLERYRQSIVNSACSGALTNDLAKKGAMPQSWRWASIAELAVPNGVFDGARDHGINTPAALNLRTTDYTQSGVRVIRLENLAWLSFLFDKRVYISEEKFAGLKQSAVVDGDVLVASFVDRGIRACVAPRLDTRAIAKADCFCIRPRPGLVLSSYLALQLACDRNYRSLARQIHGATRPRITTRQLAEISVPICNIDEQHEIVRRIDAAFARIEAVRAHVESELARLDALDRSIINRAFRGELVPQDPDDEPASVLLERIRAERAQSPSRKAGRGTRKVAKS